MKQVLKETLNENMFIELFIEQNKEDEKPKYGISVLFRYTHVSLTDYFNYEKALLIYNQMIK